MLALCGALISAIARHASHLVVTIVFGGVYIMSYCIHMFVCGVMEYINYLVLCIKCILRLISCSVSLLRSRSILGNCV